MFMKPISLLTEFEQFGIETKCFGGIPKYTSGFLTQAFVLSLGYPCTVTSGLHLIDALKSPIVCKA